MEFQARREAAAVVVALVGRLDAVTAPVYETRMHELIDGGDVRVVIDFERLDYISSAGLRGLLVTAKQLKAKGGQLRFANIQGGVRAVFDMSGFGSMFQLDESVASALSALS